MGTLETSVLGEALQRAIGERQVRHLVFCTHDLDPAFFEAEVLQTFLGDDLQHNRRTRELQLDYEIRQRGVGIDVYYERRALAAHEGAARLSWNRVAMSGRHGGVFHPKLVLALCREQADGDDDGAESLVVCTSSANLTRGGWWTNVECADVETLHDGVRHGYVAGLKALVRLLRETRSDAPQVATKAIEAFMRRQQPYQRKSVGGVVLPTLVSPYESLPGTLHSLFGRRLDNAHLEVVSPFVDADPTLVGSALTGLIEAFRPRSTTVVLPLRGRGTPMSEATYIALGTVEGVAWGALPSEYVRATSGVEAADRGLHAKVYRFWRGGANPIEVMVVGSHNLTSAAHGGLHNAEVSVVHEISPPRGRRFLLEQAEEPTEFGVLDADLEDPDHLATALPITVCFDWALPSASVRWEKTSVPDGVTLSRAGRDLCRVVPDGHRTTPLGDVETAALQEVLLASCVLTARTDDGREAPLLVVELNHAHKPDLLSGTDLTTAEILALWALPDLRTRLQQVGRSRTPPAADEDDLEHAATAPPPAPSMFDQFAGVYHAFGALRRRVDDAVASGQLAHAGATAYGETFESPAAVLRLALEDAERDPVLAYVIFRCADLLDHHVATTHPAVVARVEQPRARLRRRLEEIEGLRDRMVAEVPPGEQDELRSFLDWFDQHFTESVDMAVTA